MYSPPYDGYDYLDYKCPRRGEITELIVTNKTRSKGIGQLLINKMEEYFKSGGCEYIIVDVFAYNEIGINFYNKKGYRSRMETMIKKYNFGGNMILLKENINNVKEYNYLFDAVGWGSYEEEVSKKALNNTIYSVSLYDDEKIIGYGRLIGDSICFLYIHDVMVLPKYQNQKIGTKIMNKLLEKVNQIKVENPYVRVYLGASKGKEEFYKKFGFITREEADLGEGMILKSFEE